MNVFTRAIWVRYIFMFSMIGIALLIEPPARELDINNLTEPITEDISAIMFLFGMFGVVFTAYRDWQWSYLGLKERPTILTYVIAIVTVVGFGLLAANAARKRME